MTDSTPAGLYQKRPLTKGRFAVKVDKVVSVGTQPRSEERTMSQSPLYLKISPKGFLLVEDGSLCVKEAA